MTGWLERLRERYLGPRTVTFTVMGFRVLVENSRPDIETSAVVERLGEALALVARVQPWRYRHLQRDVSQFWVVRYPCRGAFFPAQRACMIELTFLARRDITPATVAACIVHEGMHARVHAMGVDPVSRDRAHEERICRRAELNFGHALPAELGAPVIARAAAALASSDDEVAPAIDWREARARVEAADRDALGR